MLRDALGGGRGRTLLPLLAALLLVAAVFLAHGLQCLAAGHGTAAATGAPSEVMVHPPMGVAAAPSTHDGTVPTSMLSLSAPVTHDGTTAPSVLPLAAPAAHETSAPLPVGHPLALCLALLTAGIALVAGLSRALLRRAQRHVPGPAHDLLPPSRGPPALLRGWSHPRALSVLCVARI